MGYLTLRRAGRAQEFKAFINRGNAIDLAVGVVIGAAFGRSSTRSSTTVMPVIGLLLGR